MDQRQLRRGTFTLAGLFAGSMGMAIPLAFQLLEGPLATGAAVIGAISAGFGGVQVVSRLPAGRWIDARGTRGIVQASWIATAVAGGLFLASSNLLVAGAAMLAYGLGVGLFWVGIHARVSRLAPPGEVAETMVRFLVVVGVGYTLGPLAGGLADVIGFRATLGLLAPLGVLGWLGEHRLEDPGLPQGDTRTPAVAAGGLSLGIASGFFLGFFLGASDTFIPVHLAAAGVSAFGVGLFLSAREGTNLAVRLVTARLVSDRAGVWLIALGALGTGAGSVLFPRADTSLLLALAAGIQGLGLGVLAPASLTLTARGSPPGTIGRAMGRHGAWLGVGLLVGPLALGPVGEALGTGRIFDAVAVVSVGMLAWAVYHGLSRDQQDR